MFQILRLKVLKTLVCHKGIQEKSQFRYEYREQIANLVTNTKNASTKLAFCLGRKMFQIQR